MTTRAEQGGARRRSSVATATAAIATARVASLLLAAAQVPLLARLLPEDEFALVPTTVQVAGLVGLVLADPAVLAFQRHPGSALDRVDYRWAVHRVLVGLAAGVVLLLSAGAAAGALLPAVAVAAWMLGTTANRLAAVAWLAWGREWRYSGALVASTTTRTLVLVVTVAVGGSATAALVTAGVASALLAVGLAPRTGPAADEVDRPRRASTGLGTALATGQLGVTMLGAAPLLSATITVGSAGSAALGASVQIASLVATCLNLVTTLAHPRLRRRWDDGDHAGVLESCRDLVLLCVAVGSLAVGVLTAGDLALVRAVLPAGLVDARLVVLTVVAVTGTAVGLVGSWTHQFALRRRRIVGASVASAVVTVAATLTGASCGGPLGAVLGGLCGVSCHTVLQATRSGLVRAATVVPVTVLLVGAVVVVTAPGDAATTWQVTAGALAVATAVAVLLLCGRRHRSASGLAP